MDSNLKIIRLTVSSTELRYCYLLKLLLSQKSNFEQLRFTNVAVNERSIRETAISALIPFIWHLALRSLVYIRSFILLFTAALGYFVLR